MRYDPIKDAIARSVRGSALRRKLFYAVLGLVFLREWHVKRELRRVHRLRPIKVMCDAGTGFGQYAYYCARHFKPEALLAVDVKREYIGDLNAFFGAARYPHVRCAVEDLTQPLHVQEFDLILSVDVMEHIADDIAVFRHFSQALQPGGTLIVNTPSTLGGSDAHEPGDESFIEEHARVGYDPAELTRKLEAAGLQVERRQFTYGPYGSVAWRLGIKWPMRLLGQTRLFFFLLPIYYLVTFPITLLLMSADYAFPPSRGSGLLFTARKPSS
jgi:2-polyprenyl-3-methyl-5-hydroxy-6-metoxy-1,4-benzoquinol methylase